MLRISLTLACSISIASCADTPTVQEAVDVTADSALLDVGEDDLGNDIADGAQLDVDEDDLGTDLADDSPEVVAEVVVTANFNADYSPPGPCPGEGPTIWSIYQGRALSVSGNETTMRIRKCDDTALAAGRAVWIVVGASELPSASDIDNYVARLGPHTLTTTAQEHDLPPVAIWPDNAALQAAPCNDTKHLFVITDGSDRPNQRAWLQYQAVTFTKTCP